MKNQIFGLKACLSLVIFAFFSLAAQPLLAAEAEKKTRAFDPAIPHIRIFGGADARSKIPGSAHIVKPETLKRHNYTDVNRAIREVPGVTVQEEDGFGLRPNIGIRGLAPTRSSEVLLLEDGLPLTYAPYGDNATYSHPPLRRFERIEILKGASQIRFGPHTVGGVVNYISPRAPSDFGGDLYVAGGELGYGELAASIGGEVAGFRLLGHASATEFDGIRDNHALSFQDYSLRAEREIAPGHELILRGAINREDSHVSYSGLTEAEFAADPFANPFPNDRFDAQRYTGAISHGWTLSNDLKLTTSAYSLYFNRDWWRQSSNSAQRPSDVACGGMANLSTTCGTEGRLREYHQYGIESRLSWTGALLGAETSIEAGARWHTERQRRFQVNAPTPTGRTGTIVENNTRYAEAVSGFVVASFDYGALSISPGVRVESIEFERRNGLTGAQGRTDLTEVIPGLGATYEIDPTLVVYAGIHRGFSPPRAEDVVSNAGGVVELDAERSVNWELGVRGDPADGLDIDIGAFVMDFENQIVPASVAGGVGATLTSAGETRHSGAEASVRYSFRDAGLMTGDDVYVRTALTWVAEAEYVGQRFSNISGFGTTSVTGNRLPYAPEWIASFTAGYAFGDWLNLQAEVQHTG